MLFINTDYRMQRIHQILLMDGKHAVTLMRHVRVPICALHFCVLKSSVFGDNSGLQADRAHRIMLSVFSARSTSRDLRMVSKTGKLEFMRE